MMIRKYLQQIIETRTIGKTSSPRLRWHPAPTLWLALLPLLILGGCSARSTDPAPRQPDRWDAELSNQSEPNQGADSEKSLRDQARAVLGDPTNQAGVLSGSSLASQSRWTILMSKMDTSQPELLDQTLSALKIRFPEVYYATREGETFLAHGHYTDPRSAKAKADLKAIHNYTVNLGNQTIHSYASAFIAPPSSETLAGNNPAYDLRNVRKRFGQSALYTLQIAIYGRSDRTSPSSEDLASFRRAAEHAVNTLRRDGEQAFYYHGPSRSTVTIGVFYEEDHDPSTYPPLESPRLKAAREKHPLNLLNGRGMTRVARDERGNRVSKAQESFLVGIPKE